MPCSREEENILAEHQKAIQRLTDDFYKDLKVEEDMLEQVRNNIEIMSKLRTLCHGYVLLFS